MSCAKTAEPIELPFGGVGSGWPKEPRVWWGPAYPGGGIILSGGTFIIRPMVKYRREPKLFIRWQQRCGLSLSVLHQLFTSVVKVTASVVTTATATTTTSSSVAAAVVFTIVAGNVDAAFAVDSHTGVISVARTLQRDTVPEYNLTVSAAVSSAYPLTGSSLLADYECYINFPLSLASSRFILALFLSSFVLINEYEWNCSPCRMLTTPVKGPYFTPQK